MRHQSWLRALVVVAATVAASLDLLGCSPLMRTTQTESLAAPAGAALVVFIRAGRGADRFASLPVDDRFSNLAVAVADEQGHFVASLGRNEHVAVPVTPGRHVFVAFRGAGGKIKAFHQDEPAPIPAVFIEAASGKVYFVAANLVSLAAIDHTHDPYQPNALSFGGAVETGRRIGEALFGRFGGTRLAPLGKRFGHEEPIIRDMLQSTEAREVDQLIAHTFDQKVQDQYWWYHSWQGGVELARTYPTGVRESRTLHESDGF